MENQILRVIDRKSMREMWGSSPYYQVIIKKVSTPRRCSLCGKERENIHNYRGYEEGVWYDCDIWNECCGEQYSDILAHPKTVVIDTIFL